MTDDISVTRFVRNLAAGKDVTEAQAKLFERYFQQLDNVATYRLGRFRQIVDGEDIAVKTMHIRGKIVRRGRTLGRKRNWKKAIVKLMPGERIDFFEGV